MPLPVHFECGTPWFQIPLGISYTSKSNSNWQESFVCVFNLSPDKTAFCVEATSLLFPKLKDSQVLFYSLVTVMKPHVDKGLACFGSTTGKGSSKPEKLKCSRRSWPPNSAVRILIAACEVSLRKLMLLRKNSQGVWWEREEERNPSGDKS